MTCPYPLIIIIFSNLHIEPSRHINFQLEWTILKFFDDIIDHTLAPPPLGYPVKDDKL